MVSKDCRLIPKKQSIVLFMSRNLYVRVSMVLLYPNPYELANLQTFLKSPSLIRHNLTVTPMHYNSLITHSVPESISVLDKFNLDTFPKNNYFMDLHKRVF